MSCWRHLLAEHSYRINNRITATWHAILSRTQFLPRLPTGTLSSSFDYSRPSRYNRIIETRSNVFLVIIEGYNRVESSRNASNLFSSVHVINLEARDSIHTTVEYVGKETLCQLRLGQRTIRASWRLVDGGRYDRERAIYGVGNSILEMYYDGVRLEKLRAFSSRV